MNKTLPIWRAHLKATINDLRRDMRMRIVWCIALIFDIITSLWSIHWLVRQISQWQVTSRAVLETNLEPLYLWAWAGISFFTVLAVLQRSFGNDEPSLLILLPIPFAARFRALFGLMFIDGIANWLLLEVVVVGTSLAITLGWQAFPWLAFLLLGVGVVVWCSIVTTLLMIRCILPHARRTLLIILLLLAGLILLYLAAHLAGHTLVLPSLFPFSHELMSIVFALLLALLIGPFATTTGKLYLAAFHIMEGLSRSHSAFNLPGMRFICKLLSHYRNLIGAFFFKGWLNQSRNSFTWMRLVVILAFLLLFPFARKIVPSSEISTMLLVTIYSSGLAIMAIIEYAPYAISSEGNRLAIYLVAPLRISAILRGRLIVYLCPALLVGLLSSVLLSRETGLTGIEFFSIASMVTLILLGYTAFVVYGSVWGEDLNLAVEGKMQTLLQEELPIHPRRLQLIGLSFLLLGALLLVIWKLPALLALLALVLLDGAVLAVMEYFSYTHLHKLLRID